MSHRTEYDYVVVNRVVADSVEMVRAILAAERPRRDRLVGLHDFVAALGAPAANASVAGSWAERLRFSSRYPISRPSGNGL